VSGLRAARSPAARPAASVRRDRSELLQALHESPRRIPARFFYDRRGAELFDAITRTDAYYPTRVETGILRAHAAQLADHIGRHARIVELGTGSGAKTQILLDAVAQPATYIPIDVACTQLQAVAAHLRQRYPALTVLPVCADYTQTLELPAERNGKGRTVVFFPGSTIGNMEPQDARTFLRRLTAVTGEEGLLVIGVDRKKDRRVLELAYNDPEGVTAAFNLNILAHVNRILGSDFELSGFRHYAYYNGTAGRIEMHLVSLRDQTVRIPDEDGNISLRLRQDEPIVTEHSYKYDIDEFQRLARAAGYVPIDVFTDAGHRFAEHVLGRARG
jgi:dimethylhistidine N-methyltransferase